MTTTARSLKRKRTPLRNDDVSGAEEHYHTVSFQVVPDDLSESGWTSFERSPVQQFSN
jgi:hypothetical protein